MTRYFTGVLLYKKAMHWAGHKIIFKKRDQLLVFMLQIAESNLNYRIINATRSMCMAFEIVERKYQYWSSVPLAVVVAAAAPLHVLAHCL